MFKVKVFIRKSQTFFKIINCYISDVRNVIKNSLSFSDSEDKSRARIMLYMHSLEKGMSFDNKKIGWGEKKAIELVELIYCHLKKYTKDDIVITALNILDEYLKDKFSTSNQNVKSIIQKLLIENFDDLQKNVGGVKPIMIPANNLDFENIKQFYSSRSSVREFSEQGITEYEIEQAKQIAMTTPSACNRQASRIYIFKDSAIIKQILDNQLGDQGWCHNADTLFVVTVDTSYFNATYERYQALIDGGMYAMNFCMGLHALKIATCFKMFVREPAREKRFKDIIKIKSSEIPIVLILGGHYKEEIVYSPKSRRLYMR